MKTHGHTNISCGGYLNKYFKESLKPVFIFLFMLLVHSVNGQSKYNAEVATIRSYRLASNNAISKHDLNGMSKYWLDDFVQVIGRGTYETGKENISASWNALLNSNPKVVYVRITEEIIISDNDTMAWESGKWTGIHTYSKGGNYSAMWIKRNDHWMLKAELFVSMKANKQNE